MINTTKNNALFVCGIKISPPIGWASKGSSNEAIYDGSGWGDLCPRQQVCSKLYFTLTTRLTYVCKFLCGVQRTALGPFSNLWSRCTREVFQEKYHTSRFRILLIVFFANLIWLLSNAQHGERDPEGFGDCQCWPDHGGCCSQVKKKHGGWIKKQGFWH